MSAFHKDRSASLLASLGMNLLLTVLVVIAWRRPHDAAPVLEVSQGHAHAQGGDMDRKPALAAEPPAPPFKWQQLDAPDFATFVKNLRAIGCPEATIGDIIQGELREIYAAKRAELVKEISIAPAAARAGLEESLRQLSAEEPGMLAALTGGVGGEKPQPPAVAKPELAKASASISEELPVSTVNMVPAAFLAGNDPQQSGGASVGELSLQPTDPRLNPATAHVLGEMRKEFANAVAQAGTDPASPIYRKRWMSAQRENDEIFSSMFGGDALIQAQIDAAQKQGAQGR